MTIGDRIKSRRLELGLSVDDVATRLNKNRATVYRYENNDIENLPTTVLEPLAKVLDTSPAALMGWSDDHSSTDDRYKGLFSDEIDLLSNYQKLNSLGKEKARGDVADLTEIPKYTDKGERSSLSDVG